MKIDRINVLVRTEDVRYSSELSRVFSLPRFSYVSIVDNSEFEAKLLECSPDLVILDGYTDQNIEISRSLFQLDSSIPVIFVTDSRFSRKMLTDSLEARAVDYIHKTYGNHDYLQLNVQFRGEKRKSLQSQRILEQELAGKVHDVRALFSTIYLATSILGENANPRAVDIIRRKCQDGLLFIESTLTNTPMEVLDLDRLVESYLRHYVPRELVIITSNFRSNSLIYGNSTLLTRLLTNTLSNAEEAIAQKGEINISTFRDEEKVYLTVKDTGRGMTPEHISSVFSSRMTLKNQGHGIGTAVIQKIIEIHNINVTVTSELDKGTSFTYCFPLYKGAT